MANPSEKKNDSSCLGCLLYVFGIPLWFAVSYVNWFGALCGAAAVLFYICTIYRKHRMEQQKFDNSFSSFDGKYDSMEDTDLVKLVVSDALKSRFDTEAKPISKTSLKLRSLYTVIYVAINFLLIHFLYERSFTIFLCTALTLLYTHIFLRADTLTMLAAAAKKNPDTPIHHLIEKDVIEGRTTAKRLCACGAVLMLASLAAFFTLHAHAQWTFEKDEGGYCVTGFRPGLFFVEDEIPHTYKKKPVVAIGARAFIGNSLITEMEIPDSVVRIGGKAFRGCKNLKSIEIPQGVTEIRGNTFESCSSLEKVKLHDGIVKIHAYAFRKCSSLETITLPAGITQIHGNTFEDCKELRSIEIPEGVTCIRAHAFRGCSDLRSVSVPDSLEEIRSSAFRDCDELEEIEIPQDTMVDERAFKDSPTKVSRRK